MDGLEIPKVNVSIDVETIKFLYNAALLQKDMLNKLVVLEEYRLNKSTLVNINEEHIRMLKRILDTNSPGK